MKGTIDLSVVIPVKGNSKTIGFTVESILKQEFDGEMEIIVVVDLDDASREVVMSQFDDPRLRVISPRQTFPFRGRDSNWRRGVGLSAARGQILALTDADMIFAPDWVQKGVDLLAKQDVHCVAGAMQSVDQQSFWGQYIDSNVVGSKTPRFERPYRLTKDNIGRNGFKPGVTANMFFTRELLGRVGNPRPDFLFTYDDYAFFQDIVDAGYEIYCTVELIGEHYHRQDGKDLTWEYIQSGQGCADFVLAYPRSNFTRNRVIQLGLIFAMLVLGLVVLFFTSLPVVVLPPLVALIILGAWTASKLRQPVAVIYPLVTVLLGLIFCYGVIRGLLRGGPPKVKVDQLNSDYSTSLG